MVNKITKIRTAVFGAHALDAELMSGGLLTRFSEKIEAKLFHMTRGERGHPSKDKEAFARQLEKEMEKSADKLEGEYHWAGFTAGDLPLQDATVDTVKKLILQFKPHIIITHWQGSWHPRHVNTHLLVKRALKKIKNCEENENLKLQRLLYGYNCEDLSGFSPDLFVELEECHKQKWFSALEEYELFRMSQDMIERVIPYSSHYEEQLKIYGYYCNSEYAQVFMEETKLFSSIIENETQPLIFG